MENCLFRRLHQDIDPAAFNTLGINAFESTFRALFEQASSQSSRLSRITSILSLLEEELLDPEAVESLNNVEKAALFRDLIDQSNTITRNLVRLAKPFTNLRLIIATLDGLKNYKGPPALSELKDASPESVDS